MIHSYPLFTSSKEYSLLVTVFENTYLNIPFGQWQAFDSNLTNRRDKGTTKPYDSEYIFYFPVSKKCHKEIDTLSTVM